MTRLEQLRIDAGLTRQQLSEMTGVARVTISRVEAGNPTITPTLTKLAKPFGVPPSDLIRPALPITERAA